jgi:hypothetical protein
MTGYWYSIFYASRSAGSPNALCKKRDLNLPPFGCPSLFSLLFAVATEATTKSSQRQAP